MGCQDYAATPSETETKAIKAFAEAYRSACAAGPQTYSDLPTCQECGSPLDEHAVSRTEFDPFHDALMSAWEHLNAMAWAERHASVVLTRRGRNLLDCCLAAGYPPFGFTSQEITERMLITIHAIADKLGIKIPETGA